MRTISNYFERVRSAWSPYGKDRLYVAHMSVTILGFFAFLRWGISLISELEARNGRLLNDPLLASLTPLDFSPPIFILIYSGIIITAIRTMKNPARMLLGMQATLLILTIRTACIYLVPLEPPPGMILLEDPFIGWVFGSQQNVAVKDLFFSGHVSSMCILILVTEPGYWRKYLIVATASVALMIVWQHVHYSIDILAAPVVSFSCYKLVDEWHKRTSYGILDQDYELGLDKLR